MTEDRNALLEHYRQMRADLLAAIAGLSDAQMTDATLDGWSVKDHLAHIALWDEVRAGEVARISAGYESAWLTDPDTEDTYSALGYAMRQSLSLDQARWELATSRQTLLDAIATAARRGLDASRYGEAALRSSHEAEHTGWIRRWRTGQGR